MKFVCERCKTRYSIGDDRVRGKILKIRCKSCSHVITVREGMPSPDAADPTPADPAAPRRGQKTTTVAPAVQSEAPALARPVTSGSGKPSATLEDEWYVSIDGEQAGPFSLGDAQRWVAAQPPDADLFCWNEGFDDWLPVDKVSHFRSARKPPAPSAPPPVPARPAPRDSGAPKPAFASTMGQLEGGGAAPERGGLGGALEAPSPLRSLGSPAAGRPLDLRGVGARPEATPPNGLAARANGAVAPPAIPATPATPAAPAAPAASEGRPPRGGMVNAATTPGFGLARPPATGFDASEANDAATQMDAQAYDSRAATLDPFADVRGARPDDRTASGADALGAGGGDGDDLDIGEVSRVVKLADLAKDTSGRASAAPVRAPALSRTGAIPRLSAPRPVEPAGAAFAADAPALDSPAVAAEPAPAVSNRRGLVALIAGAIVLVGVAVAVVVFFVRSGDEVEGGRLGRVDDVDTRRPDEVRRAGGTGGSAVGPSEPPPNPFDPRPRQPVNPVKPPVNPPSGNPPPPDSPGAGARLEAQEIEDMAAKSAPITQRCYMRAQRGAEGIMLGDLKKVTVTLTVAGDGTVTEASLSDDQSTTGLGKCLITVIRGWKFRTSPGGTFRFVLYFG